jgi:hypothetical protein
MATTTPYPRHSACVQMRLLIGGHSLRVAQMGPNFLILDDTADYPPGNAEIVLSVDGQAERWTVHLPNGLHAGQKEVLVSKA